MINIKERARRRAAESRRSVGLNLLVPVEIWQILLAAEISILRKPLKSNISGLFMRKGSAKLILINTARTVGHQNFTGCHEYFHLLYDEGIEKKICQVGYFDPRNPNEREADYFAAYFLVPDEALEFQTERRLKGKKRHLNMSDVIALEQIFCVSHKAMLVRLNEAGYLTSEEIKGMKSGVLALAMQLGYDTKLYLSSNEDNVLSNYAEKAKIALEAGLISQGKYEELLLKAGLEELVFGDVGEDDEWDETIPL
jgi:Zn-dependent peptidase ImmA (M78 family)